MDAEPVPAVVTGIGRPVARTWRAYVYDQVTWVRFLAEQRGRSVLAVTRVGLEAFHTARRLPALEFGIEASSWGRLDAALEKFYRGAARPITRSHGD